MLISYLGHICLYLSRHLVIYIPRFMCILRSPVFSLNASVLLQKRSACTSIAYGTDLNKKAFHFLAKHFVVQNTPPLLPIVKIHHFFHEMHALSIKWFPRRAKMWESSSLSNQAKVGWVVWPVTVPGDKMPDRHTIELLHPTVRQFCLLLISWHTCASCMLECGSMSQVPLLCMIKAWSINSSVI